MAGPVSPPADRVFAALGDPHRRTLLLLVRDLQPVPASRLYAHFPTSAPAISKHLRVLREAGLVRTEVRGPQRLYSLEDSGLAVAADWLEDCRREWAARLDQLEAHLERTKEEGSN